MCARCPSSRPSGSRRCSGGLARGGARGGGLGWGSCVELRCSSCAGWQLDTRARWRNAAPHPARRRPRAGGSACNRRGRRRPCTRHTCARGGAARGAGVGPCSRQGAAHLRARQQQLPLRRASARALTPSACCSWASGCSRGRARRPCPSCGATEAGGRPCDGEGGDLGVDSESRAQLHTVTELLIAVCYRGASRTPLQRPVLPTDADTLLLSGPTPAHGHAGAPDTSMEATSSPSAPSDSIPQPRGAAPDAPLPPAQGPQGRPIRAPETCAHAKDPKCGGRTVPKGAIPIAAPARDARATTPRRVKLTLPATSPIPKRPARVLAAGARPARA